MLAAGDGTRSGHHTNKVLLPLAGRRVFTWSIRWARLLPEVCRTLVVIREQDREVVTRAPTGPSATSAEYEPPSVVAAHFASWKAGSVSRA